MKVSRRRWIGIAALSVVAAAFLAYSLPPYLTGDPAQSRVPASFSAHYPLLVVHVTFATLAMTTALLQVWPRLRNKHPAVHRRIGLVYVFGAALPAGVSGLIIGAATPFGPILAVSNVTMASLWLGCTLAGYRAARSHRYWAHRRWMLRSIVLTFSIISNRIWTPVLYFALSPLYDSVFHGNEVTFIWVLAGLTGWLGWTIPLLVLEWWLRRKDVMPPSSISQLADTRPG